MIALCLVCVFPVSDSSSTRVIEPATTPFDEYGRINWETEQAHLDNFAIQLLQDPDVVGYIFVYDGNDLCDGEAQARAIRATKYLVERRGIPRNRVI